MLRREGEARREQQLNNKAGNGEAAMAFPDAQSQGGCAETPGLPTAPAALAAGPLVFGEWGRSCCSPRLHRLHRSPMGVAGRASQGEQGVCGVDRH